LDGIEETRDGRNLVREEKMRGVASPSLSSEEEFTGRRRRDEVPVAKQSRTRADRVWPGRWFSSILVGWWRGINNPLGAAEFIFI
jgi:hypothetical protein